MRTEKLVRKGKPAITLPKRTNARKLKEYFSTSLLALKAAFLSAYLPTPSASDDACKRATINP
jgi:hypothetical protein